MSGPAPARASAQNIRQCPVCQERYYRRGTRKNTATVASTCSRACANKQFSAAVASGKIAIPRYKRGQNTPCVVCGKSTYSYPSKQKRHCSWACKVRNLSNWDHARGPNNKRWRGGTSNETQRQRGSILVRSWSKMILWLGRWRCVKCGYSGGGLAADHILPWALYPSLRTAFRNGQVLCRTCHKEKTAWDRKIIWGLRFNKYLLGSGT